MNRYNKYQTKQCTHAHTSTLQTSQMMASTGLENHQERPSAPTNSLHKLHMAYYRSTYLLTYLLTHKAFSKATAIIIIRGNRSAIPLTLRIRSRVTKGESYIVASVCVAIFFIILYHSILDRKVIILR